MVRNAYHNEAIKTQPETDAMEEIAQAFSEYAALLANLKWLKENGQLAADADVGVLAYHGAIYYKSPHVNEAFVAAMEIAKAERERQAALPKRVRASSSEKSVAVNDARRQRELDINERAKQLSSELALIA